MERLTASPDVLVIGGGIAGISAAALLSAERSVTVLETEAQLGLHATGRSAAMLIDGYGNAAVRAVTAAARPFFAAPDPRFWPLPLLSPRGELLLARPGQEAALAAQVAAVAGAVALSPEEAAELAPILLIAAVAGALYAPDAADIDVDLLLQGFVKLLRCHGGRVATGAGVTAIHHGAGLWRAATPAGEFSAPVVVNAAGAWADALAGLAGLPPVGLQPLRRSAAILPTPGGHDAARWPLFGSLDEDWYARPLGGRLMVSPADEDPVPPQDAYPDDMALAEGLDRFERMTLHPVTRIERSWAGLRSFVADRTPVVGFDPQAEGFFWLAGQGGYGIQTAPALARLARDLICGRAPGLPQDIVAALSPARLRDAQGPSVSSVPSRGL